MTAERDARNAALRNNRTPTMRPLAFTPTCSAARSPQPSIHLARRGKNSCRSEAGRKYLSLLTAESYSSPRRKPIEGYRSVTVSRLNFDFRS